MQRRYVERFSLGTQSHFQAGSTKEQKSCLQAKRLCQTVPEVKENNVGVPDTISECRVTCYHRVKRRYTKLSAFPVPIPVQRRSSPSPIAQQCRGHRLSHTVLRLDSLPKPLHPAELVTTSCRRRSKSLCLASRQPFTQALSKGQPLPPPATPRQTSLRSGQGQHEASQRQSSYWQSPMLIPAQQYPRQSRALTPAAHSGFGVKSRSSHLGPYLEPTSGFAVVASFLLLAQRASMHTLNLLSRHLQLQK